MLEPCGLTAERLESALLYELKPLASDFLAAESETEINAVFLASVAALESGWGRYCANDNNLFGWTDGGGYMAFDSKEDCISYVSQALKENYLSPDGCYFEGYTVDAVNKHYNGRKAWADSVKEIMQGIYESA